MRLFTVAHKQSRVMRLYYHFHEASSPHNLRWDFERLPVSRAESWGCTVTFMKQTAPMTDGVTCSILFLQVSRWEVPKRRVSSWELPWYLFWRVSSWELPKIKNVMRQWGFFWVILCYIHLFRSASRLIKNLPVPLGTLLRKRVRLKPAASLHHMLHLVKTRSGAMCSRDEAEQCSMVGFSLPLYWCYDQYHL